MRYPYLLLSLTDRSSLDYVGPEVRSAIIDAGVHKVFHEWGLKEYPLGYRVWIHRMVQLYDYVRRFVGDVWVVVPDYPSDYPNNPIKNNVELTIRNIEYALDNYSDVRWIIPIQGRPNNIQSIADTISNLKQLGLLKSEYIAIAPTCTTKSIVFLRRLAFTARHLLKDKKIHMFGVTTKAWKDVAKYINSTDTISHNFYCMSYLGRKCTTQVEHILGWLGFLNKLLKDSYIDNETYEKALLSIKTSIGSKEFETIMHLFRTDRT
jgi:hypothetical protein